MRKERAFFVLNLPFSYGNEFDHIKKQAIRRTFPRPDWWKLSASKGVLFLWR